MGAVVQIAFEPPPRVVAGHDDPGAGRGEFGAGLGIGDRGCNQIREILNNGRLINPPPPIAPQKKDEPQPEPAKAQQPVGGLTEAPI